MAEFPIALKRTLDFEGGFFQNEKTGEVVNYGITSRFLASIGLPHSVDDVRALTVDTVTPLYEKYFWNPICGDQIDDQTIANHIFDVGVNQGVETSVKELQEAVNDCLPRPFAENGDEVGLLEALIVDGVVGPKTISEVNACVPVTLLAVFRAHAAARYREVAAENPELAADLPGWLERLASN